MEMKFGIYGYYLEIQDYRSCMCDESFKNRCRSYEYRSAYKKNLWCLDIFGLVLIITNNWMVIEIWSKLVLLFAEYRSVDTVLPCGVKGYRKL